MKKRQRGDRWTWHVSHSTPYLTFLFLPHSLSLGSCFLFLLLHLFIFHFLLDLELEAFGFPYLCSESLFGFIKRQVPNLLLWYGKILFLDSCVNFYISYFFCNFIAWFLSCRGIPWLSVFGHLILEILISLIKGVLTHLFVSHIDFLEILEKHFKYPNRALVHSIFSKEWWVCC